MNKICKNCRYIKKYEKLTYCDLIEVNYNVNNLDTSLATIGVEVLDDTGLEVNLLVNENFGCVLFEEK